MSRSSGPGLGAALAATTAASMAAATSRSIWSSWSSVSWPGLGDPGAEPLEAVEVLPGVADLVGPVELLVALEVPEVAGELDLDQGRAAALAGPGHGLAGRLVHGEEVEPVDDHTGHPERRGPVGDVVGGHRPGRRGGLGVAVVLRDEDRRQVPDRGQVQRLQGGALVGGAVAEERDRHAAVALDASRPARARRSAAGRRRRCRSRRACPWTGRRCASSRPCPGTSRWPCRRSRPSCP